MGKAKHHRSTTGQQLQTAVKPEIKQVAQNSKHANNATREAWCTVGKETTILKDYLDMKDLPEENGLANCGYLVLRKSDIVRILYVGSSQTDDPGWLYGEVIQCLSRGGVGQRGWLPASIVEPPDPKLEAPARSTGVAEIPKVAVATTPAQSTKKQSVGYAVDRSSTLPKQKSPVADFNSTSAPLRGPLGERRDGSAIAKAKAKAGQQRQQLLRDEAFPALPGHSGRCWWEEESEETEETVSVSSSSQPVAPSTQPRPRDVEGTIARHRAMAAAAAAKAKGNNGNASSKINDSKSSSACPICMESFSGQRRITQTPCCAVLLCMACSEKSIKSSRCYFCREAAEEFPSLGASTGFSKR